MISIERCDDDDLLIAHYREHWLDMGLSPTQIRDDWHISAQRFFLNARANGQLGSFVAISGDVLAGSASCHMVEQGYPAFRKQDVEHVGYLWGVYVLPEFRGHGIGSQLISECLNYLRKSGCQNVTLHAGEKSAALYRRHGFEPTHEMSRPL